MYKYLYIIFLFFLDGNHFRQQKTIVNSPKVEISSISTKAKNALSFCKSHNMNQVFCILIDMTIHSGKKRFFVWDFKKDTISYSFLVSHGCCSNPWSKDQSKEAASFSNTDGSHCSSLGKYKIGERAYSSWGVKTKYFLYGLEPTNSNALGRAIVLHSWESISDKEIYPKGTPEGWGCPSISNNAFKTIDSLLKTSKQSILLWIYKD